MKNNILFKKVEDQTIAWLENNNEYLILQDTTADIIKRLNKGVSVKEISKAVSKKISAPLDKTHDLVLDLEKKILNSKTIETEQIINDYRDVEKPFSYEYTKFYKVNQLIFKVEYLSEKELSLIHPKYAHLEVSDSNYNHEFKVFIEKKHIILLVNKKFIGAWSHKDVHYFQGKFSMELIQKIHQKEEKEWLGVFHASAVSNGKKSILFLGDSGNGKSTSLALLQANGFTCLADDFVPVDVKKQEVYSFPASISIKKNSLETLLPIYPELENSAEYHFKRLNKIVRF